MLLQQWAARTCKYNYIQELFLDVCEVVIYLFCIYQQNREIFLKRSHLTFTSSNSTLEALRKGVKYVQS